MSFTQNNLDDQLNLNPVFVSPALAGKTPRDHFVH